VEARGMPQVRQLCRAGAEKEMNCGLVWEG